MLPTKGYFQDIECPFNDTPCGRPYCHFRHRKRPAENIDEPVAETSKSNVPVYKPTPKSELENIQNKTHIPISYVPDLAFRNDRPLRTFPKFEKPTYKPTPLSLLSSASNKNALSAHNEKQQETIKDIQQNIANNEYDPQKSEINFEDLSSEFDLIDEIINEDESDHAEPETLISENLTKINSDIKKEQNRLNLLLKNDLNTDSNIEKIIKNEKVAIETNGGDKKVKRESGEPVNVKKESNGKDVKKSEADVLHLFSESSPNKTEKRPNDKSDKKASNTDKKVEKLKTKTISQDQKNSSERSLFKVKVKDEKKRDSKSHEREKHRKEEKRESKPNQKHERKSQNRDKSPKEDKSNNKNSSSDNSDSDQPNRRDRSGSGSQQKHKKRSRSRRRSKTREKERGSHKRKKESGEKPRKKSRSSGSESERSTARHRNSHSDRDGDKRSAKKKSATKVNSERPHKSTGCDSDNDNELISMDTNELGLSDVDLDLDDEDETMRECFRIFNEYKPKPLRLSSPKTEETDKSLLSEDEYHSASIRKRIAHSGAENSKLLPLPAAVKTKPVITPGQIMSNRYKIAKLAQANNEQENIMNEVRQITAIRSAPSLLEAARMHKLRRLERQKQAEKAAAQKPSTNVVDDILNGAHKPGVSKVKLPVKKIAAVPNVALIEKAKERISLIKQRRLEPPRTVAQTQKSGRVAHVPEVSLPDIPDVLQADKSKLPVNVRTRFLTMIVEECCKLYAAKQDAYTRALNEEFSCYEKCTVLTTYRNSAMLAVNRLRKEIQERENRFLGPLMSGESTSADKGSIFRGRMFYDHVKKWVLTEDELDLHGYPRESREKGKAVINNQKDVDYSIVDENLRKCSRCSKIYQVDDDGWPLFEEECMYHPLKKRTIRGEQVFLCCKSTDDTGCVTSDTHVCEGSASHQLEGYQTTLPPERENDPRSCAVYALDCEMCYTTKGLELTRVTIVDADCKTIYESLVKPLNPIVDYNTRFSGITKEQMDRTSTSILQVQANILHLCNSETILAGHSLESDMKALKIVHSSVIDTSILFPHKMGLPHKRALRALASEYLKKIIQNDVSGHDSAEDAITCMELIKWKLKEECKVRTK
ncbi:RNA exonuclease 1 homolog [Cylas formicarius]|uniref:RNA exonuclease 1 homolog n=1 Tax=Cylas formicarius TaxID=197179 RepID=UPI0029585921|nr:RNA exonuclease 1 homolog [Cylas formicarius]